MMARRCQIVRFSDEIWGLLSRKRRRRETALNRVCGKISWWPTPNLVVRIETRSVSEGSALLPRSRFGFRWLAPAPARKSWRTLNHRSLPSTSDWCRMVPAVRCLPAGVAQKKNAPGGAFEGAGQPRPAAEPCADESPLTVTWGNRRSDTLMASLSSVADLSTEGSRNGRICRKTIRHGP